MRPSPKITLISLTRKRLLSRLVHWRLVALPSTRCFMSPVLIGGLASYARQITMHMKKTSWAKNEAHLAWMALFSRNQCLDYLGFYRARSTRTPAARKRLGICHCQPHATLIAGTTEPLSLLWRRPVTKSPGPSSPLLDRYRPRRMDLYRLGSFHRVLLVTRHYACTMAPEMCRLINSCIGVCYCSAGNVLVYPARFQP